MPGRKRPNPQRLDVENEAKRQELSFFQFVPREKPTSLPPPQIPGQLPASSGTDHALQPISDLENNGGVELPQNTDTQLRPTKPKKRKGKRKTQKAPLPPKPKPLLPQLPQDIVDSLILTAAPKDGPSRARSVQLPLLHQFLTHSADAERIHITRQTFSSLSKDKLILIGKILVELKHAIPLTAIFTACSSAVRLSLVCSSLPTLLKIEVGEGQYYLETQRDTVPRTSLDTLFAVFCRSRFAKLYLVPAEEDDPLIKCLQIELWVNEKLCELGGASEQMKQSSAIHLANDLVRALYPGALEDTQNSALQIPASTSHNVSVVAKINQFYKQVQEKRRQESGADLPFDASTIEGLTAELRGYQCRALKWMLEREKEGEVEGGGEGEQGELHMLWKELPTSEHGLAHPVYFNRRSGKFSLTRFSPEPMPRGGILADEMGLGKTVEILALIMAHQWPGPLHCRDEDSSTRVSNPTQQESGFTHPESCFDSTCPESGSDSTQLQSNSDSTHLQSSSTQPVSVTDSAQPHPMEVELISNPVGTGSSTDPIVIESASNSQETQLTTLLQEQATEKASIAISKPSVIEIMETEPSPTNVTEKSPSKRPYLKPSTSPKKKKKNGASSSKEDVVQCLCGATKEGDYDGEFVQCERCLVWQHSMCANFISERHSDNFACIKCLLDKPLPSKTTLIISPLSIAQQWMDEIRKHTEPGALKVLMYSGVSVEYMSPFELSTYDVVLVSYETLRTEFYHATSQEVSRTLRHRKRYACYPSPLPAVLWWRVCLDEAQMVENTSVKAAEMTMKLSAVNRWCVTGTPVQRDLMDLYGLVLFLGVDPYHRFFWFNQLVWQPFIRGHEEPMISLFSSIMWRHSKADVMDELHLPDHSEEIHWLWFSSVEAYFYRRQKETCFNNLMKALRGLPEDHTSLSSLLQSTVNKLMTPLHSLRQACCHPQIVKSGYLNLPSLWNRRRGRRWASSGTHDSLPISVTNRNCMSMTDLLEKLIQQAKVEAREALRLLVASLNGLAAVYVLKEEWPMAVEAYREAMSSWQEHEAHEVECDKLQRIHTMENLSELLDMGYGNETPTLRDDRLKEEAVVLRGKYSEKAEGQVKAAAEAMLVCKENILTAKLEANWLQADYLGEAPPLESGSPSDLQDKSSGHTDCQMEQHGPTVEQSEASTELPQPENKENDLQDSDCPESSYPEPSVQVQDQEGIQEKGADKNREENDHEAMKDDSENQRDVPDKGTDEVDEVNNQESIENDGDNQQPAEEKTKERKPVVHPSEPWWISVCDWCTRRRFNRELVNAINAEMEAEQQDYFAVSLRFRGVDGLNLSLCSSMDRIELARELTLSSLEKLVPTPDEELVARASACHLTRRLDEDDLYEDPEECECCIAEQKIVNYEHLIFSRFRLAEEGLLSSDHGDGSRGMSMFERILRCMLVFIRHKGAPQKLMAAGQALINHIDAVKKEYKALRTLWMAIEQRLCVCDELKMAATKLRFMTPLEIVLDMEVPSAVHPLAVDAHIAQFNGDKQEARAGLKKSLGQVLYLKNLAKVKDKDGENTELCPICTSQLGVEWGVFTCGHSVCLECIVTLIKRQVAWNTRCTVLVRCPLCREPSLSTEINYVKINASKTDSIQVQGSHSTKVIAVTRTLIDIQRNDPGAKALVFSSWLEILELVSWSLGDNDIKYQFLKTKTTFQANLTEFKSSPDVNVLLIPFHSGSKGLNIVEASHVLLVEPLLNVGIELQAIGRVHRMGQTRPTKVHRFYVKNTVEEKVHQLLNNQPDRSRMLMNKDCESVLTIHDIKNLFNE